MGLKTTLKIKIATKFAKLQHIKEFELAVVYKLSYTSVIQIYLNAITSTDKDNVIN